MTGGPFWARHYGFGAARIPLGAPAHRPDPEADLAGALQQLDLSTLRLLRAAPLVMLLSVLFLAGISALPFREPASDTQIVMLRAEPIVEELPEPLVEVRPPQPVPVAAEPEPAPPPPKPATAEPAPRPKPAPPARIAEAPKPPPPAVRASDPPPRSRPAPRVPPAPAFAARAPTQPPATPTRVARRQAPRAPESLRPPPPGVAAAPDAAPADVPRISARSRGPRPERSTPKRSPSPSFAALAAPEAPVGVAPAAPSRQRPTRSTPRPAAATSRRAVTVAAAAPSYDPEPSSRATRSAASRPKPESRPSRRAPAPAAPAAPAPTRPTSRPSAVPAPVRAERKIAARPQRDEQKLAGVPLGSLASCMSDREEDDLKRRLIAQVSRPGRCQSPSGTYQFVETKNLNAFLMWVQRASDRATADRCVELSLALDCVKMSGVQESRG